MKSPSSAQSYLREKQVLELLPVNRSTLWRWVKDGYFPKPRKVSSGVTVWSRNEVLAFVEGGHHA